MKVGRGRKKADNGNAAANAALTARFDVYKAMRELIKRIRLRSPNDDLGWDAYLSDQMVLSGVTGGGSSSNARFESGLISQDDIQEMDIEIV